MYIYYIEIEEFLDLNMATCDDGGRLWDATKRMSCTQVRLILSEFLVLYAQGAYCYYYAGDCCCSSPTHSTCMLSLLDLMELKCILCSLLFPFRFYTFYKYNFII